MNQWIKDTESDMKAESDQKATRGEEYTGRDTTGRSRSL